METTSAALLLKDIEEIYARLFNHHPVVSGEIKYFLKEFEERRNDREIERLFKVLEKTTHVRETQLDKIKSNADAHLCGLTADFEVALSMCDRILNNDKRHLEEDGLSEMRKTRAIEWEMFLQDMTTKQGSVDETFLTRETELRKHYKDLESQLTNHPPH